MEDKSSNVRASLFVNIYTVNCNQVASTLLEKVTPFVIDSLLNVNVLVRVGNFVSTNQFRGSSGIKHNITSIMLT